MGCGETRLKEVERIRCLDLANGERLRRCTENSMTGGGGGGDAGF